MLFLMKRIFVFLCYVPFLWSAASQAFNIGEKNHVQGPVIHLTYFSTPHNSSFLVQAKLYAGKYLNGTCQYNSVYDIGSSLLKTGDFVNVDSYALRGMIGTQQDCASIYYTKQQTVLESFQLIFDGINYVNTLPEISEVTII